MIKNGILILIAVIYSASLFAQPRTLLSGKVVSTDKSVIDFATVYLKGTQYGCTTNEQGIYHLHAPAGKYTLIISAVGFETYEKTIDIVPNERNKQTVVLKPSITELDEVVVTSTGVNRVKKSAFNAVAVDTKELHNSTKSLSEALSQLPGMKLRESGGVGSDMQLMLDGFSGKHVKVFIDGVPQEGAGTAFDLNNIPVNFAERIEVYKGVVPVGFGTDALGGVINIVTNKKRRNWFLDASYSYGSFNTHKSYVNFGQTFKNGLMYEINAFQNYSDNDYYIDNYITEFGEDGITESTDKNKIYHVKRFNDTFHNEAVIGKIGVMDKTWADRLIFSFNYSHFYKEIQTGVYQYVVFGQKHRKGYSFVPSVEYRKRNLLIEGLDISATANYNHNITHNIDTAAYKYNWLGDKKYTGTPGEQSHQNNESKNTNWNGTFTCAILQAEMDFAKKEGSLMMNWIWLGAVVAFGVLEAATAALVSIWFVGGAAVALLASFLGAALWLQIALFLAVSVGILAAVRPLIKRANAKTVPTNLDRVIGCTARVTEEIDNEAGTGAVYVEGKTWTARSSDGSVIPIGTKVTVERMEGVKLFVMPERTPCGAK